MNVVRKDKYVDFGSLDRGELFSLRDELNIYMKTLEWIQGDEFDENIVNAVNIESGSMEYFGEEEGVMIVYGKFYVE